MAGDWLADRWAGLRRPPPRHAGQGLPLPAWVIDALAEPDLRDAGR